MAKRLTDKDRQKIVRDVDRLVADGWSVKGACVESGFHFSQYYKARNYLKKSGQAEVVVTKTSPAPRKSKTRSASKVVAFVGSPSDLAEIVRNL